MLPWPLHHIGIAVTDLNESIKTYARSFNCKVSLREELTEQGVSLAFLDLPNTKLELLAPLRDTSLLAKFLVKRGPGLHHLCYQVSEIDVELQRLIDSGFEAIDLVPRKGAEDSRIAFLQPKPFQGVLVELCEPRLRCQQA